MHASRGMTACAHKLCRYAHVCSSCGREHKGLECAGRSSLVSSEATEGKR